MLLVPRGEVVQARNDERASPEVYRTWAHLDAATRAETPKVGLWLDSSELSAEETVEQIWGSAEVVRLEDLGDG